MGEMKMNHEDERLSSAWLGEKNLLPNRGRWNRSTKVLTLVVKQSARGDFALSCGVRELMKAEDDGTLTEVTVELVDGAGNKLAQKPAREVLQGLKDAPPLAPTFPGASAFWWLRADFRNALATSDGPF
jgi:hypothetical protein